MVDLRWGAATHPGLIREQNEDAYVAEGLVFGVADGMGGHQAGEIASALAAQTLRDRLVDGASSIDVVIAAVIEANAAIFQAAHGNATQRGMGTTLTAIAILDGDGDGDASGGPGQRIALVNVGDSRTYLYRDGALRRVTIDHNYVQELVSTGHITEQEARTHPRRNIVTRALGIEPNVRVDSWELPLTAGDRFILCSDGLVDEVEDLAIASVAAGLEDPQAAAEELVAMANRSGGRDNTTVIVLDVLETVPSPLTVPDLPVVDGSVDDGHATIDTAAGPPPLPPEAGAAAAAPPPLPAMAPVGTPDRTPTAPMPDPTPTPVAGTPAAGTPVLGVARLTNADGETAEVRDAVALPEATPVGPSTNGGRRRITGTQFGIGVAVAAVVTLLVVLLALALTGDDGGEEPVDSVTPTTEAETDQTEPDDTEPDDTAPDESGPSTTTRPTTTTTRPAATTTSP